MITGATTLIITTVIISLVASSHAIGRLFVAIVLHTIMRTAVLGSSVVVTIGVMVLAVAIVHQVLASIGRRCAAAIIVVATCVAC